jgi:Domain of unknown function (DUF4411)
MIRDLPHRARYSLDTGCLINSWRKHYPPDMFGPVWQHLDGLIRDGATIASAEVLFKIERQDDELCAWCKDREAMFVDLIDPLQDQVTALLAEYPRLVAMGRNRADPFVIGVARLTNELLTVVTEETGHRASANKPKIPFICQEKNMRCIPLVEMLRETGWRMAR